MFYANELRFLQKILSKCNLDSFIINPNSPHFPQADSLLPDFFTNNSGKTFYDFFPNLHPATVYRATDVFLSRYIFLILPFYEEENVLVIGPYLCSEPDKQQILEQGEKMNISAKNSENLILYYASLPIIKEEHHIFAMVNSFAEFIWGGSGNFESRDINFEPTVVFGLNSDRANAYNTESVFSIDTMEKRYSFENDLITAVSQGNIHKAELMFSSFSSLAFESRVTDPLRNMKNYSIIMNTLLRKAAESGGVHPVHLDSISSDFAKRIENIHSLPLIRDLMTKMLRTYCLSVQQHSINKYSPIIQKAIIRIEHDLTSDLSLKTLAELSNVSEGYFSSIFKKETGQTLTQYINNKRIKLAKHLLKTTKLQVQTIAQHCGVLDFHYFCRMFKNSVNKTPTEYREEITFD